MGWAVAIPAAIGAVGTILAYKGYKQSKDAAQTASDAAAVQGQKKREGAYFEAAQMEVAAGQEVASAQREVLLVDRQRDLMTSRAIAVAAASGAGASDRSVTNLVATINGESAYQRAVSVYGGADRARKLLLAAKTRRYEGEMALEAGEAGSRSLSQQASAYGYRATAELVSGAGGLFGKYGAKYMTTGGETDTPKTYSGDDALLYQNADAGLSGSPTTA